MERRETEMIEFRKSTAQLKEGVISICAMLNKHGCGTVYFGIKDDGSVCGQDIGKKTRSDISHEMRNNLKPIPSVTIRTEIAEGKEIIAVEASGEDTPYSAYGRYYTRVDDSDIVMDAQQLWKYFEAKSKTHSKWEETPTSYTIDDVNEELLIQYIRDANECGRLNYVYRNSEDALHTLGLVSEDGHLNNAGYYLFGSDGPVLLKEAIYPTDNRTVFTDLKQFSGNIFECINEGMKYIQNNIHYHSEIIGSKREERPEIPAEALREIVINSFAHCHYQKGDYNEITISKSRVRIYNPGGIINDTNPKDFASGKVGSKIRNPLIATVLYKNGMIDVFGTGFDRTFTICGRQNIDYEYRNDDFGFTFVFIRKGNDRLHDAANDIIKTKQFLRLTELDEKLLRLIGENSYITISELAKKTNKSEPTIYRHLERLMSAGKLVRIGSRKNGSWNLLE